MEWSISPTTELELLELEGYVTENQPKLNDEQQLFYEAVNDSVRNEKGQLFSLDAPGGTGKTFLICILLAQVRFEKKVAFATAVSGIATTLLPNGRMLHSRCKVPLSIKEDSVCNITKTDSTGQLIKQCHLLVIDEVSMCDRRIIEALDWTFHDIRETDRSFEEIGEFKVQVKEDYLNQEENVKSLTDIIFSNLSTLHADRNWLCSRTILCPTNEAVDEVNAIVLRQYPGNESVYLSSDKIMEVENRHQYPVEFLNSICASGMPPHKLCLKKGAPIMLLRNFDSKNGHCNGNRYIVDNLMPNLIDATLATGPHAGNKIFIPRIPIIPSENLFPFQMQRKQFPVRLCFAMTSNKAQGQTLEKVGINLQTDFFSHGQLYVAMSRVGSSDNIKMFAKNFKERKGTFISNVVYPEVRS
uniref:ATP-dependent DNA helicase PIF1-like n=1 Tax=Myxine glutinosa TaxID=7769 RepID=UPI00358F66B7